MKKIVCVLMTALLFGCNSSEDKAKESGREGDSTGIENKRVAFSFDEKEFKQLELPLVIDTNFILEADTSERIPYQQIRQLGKELLGHELSSGIEYDLNSFCEVDSIKQAGRYQEYIDKIEIGMTKVAISFKVGVIKFNDGSKLFVWGVHNSSFEACPFFAGTTIIGTYTGKSNKNVHFVLGEISGGGDPPSMGDDEVTSKVNSDGKIEIHGISVNDNLDIPGEETTLSTLILKLQEGSITIVDSKKKANNTEKANP